MKFATIIVFVLLLLMSVVVALTMELQNSEQPRYNSENFRGGYHHSGYYRKFPENIIRASHGVPEAVDYRLFEIAPGHVTMYSSTMPWHVKSLQSVLHREFPTAPRTIVDATAHIGADTANFMRTFPAAEITAVEIDPAIAAITRRNVARIYGSLQSSGTAPRVICADAADYIRALPSTSAPDLLYLDPPWGNNLRHARRVGSFSAPQAIAQALAAGTRAVAIRLPHDTDLDTFERAVDHCAKGLKLSSVTSTRSAICDARRMREPTCPTHKLGLGMWLLIFRK